MTAPRAAARPPVEGAAVTLSLPVGRWPDAEREAWEAAFEPPSRPSYRRGGRTSAAAARGGKPPHRWRAAHRANVERAWGMWAAYRARRGLASGALPCPVAFAAFVDEADTRGCSPVSVANYAVNVLAAARVLHPARDWGWLAEDARALRADATPTRDKASKVVAVHGLLNLGLRLMAEAEAARACVRTAVLHRDGLCLAVLAYRPARAANFLAMRVGEHLVIGADGSPVALRWPGCQTKNGRPIEQPFPAPLAAPARRHLERHRAVLANAGGHQDGGALWLNRFGRPLGQAGLWLALAKRTEEAFGRRVNPHLIRACYASTFAEEEPGLLPLAGAMLGHRDPRSLEPYQVAAASLGAARALERTLAPLREEAGAKGKPRRPP